MEVPSGSEFLVGPISFSGPNCQPNIVFQVNINTLKTVLEDDLKNCFKCTVT